jgi:hypothetical protein
MPDHTDPETLIRSSIGRQFGAEPIPGYGSDADEIALPIVGRTLSMVGIADSSYYLRLHFWGSPDLVIEVEGSGTIRPAGRASIAFEPAVGPFVDVLHLIGKPVTEAVATGGGRLRLTFADGSTFGVDEPTGYETWQLRDDEHEYLVVTHAGGGIVQFGEPPGSTSGIPTSTAGSPSEPPLWRRLLRRSAGDPDHVTSRDADRE